MEWLRAPELQGIAALIAIGQVLFAIMRSLKHTPASTAPQPVSTAQSLHPAAASRVAGSFGALLFLLFGWLIYSIPWALLAVAFHYPPTMVISLLFFILGAFIALGVLLTRAPIIGGLLGGGVPLGTVANVVM